MNIRGEYWIENGSVMDADGDIGEYNHEARARDTFFQHYEDEIYYLADEYEIEHRQRGYEGPDSEGLTDIIKSIHDKLTGDDGESEENDPKLMSPKQADAYLMQQLQCDGEAFNILLGGGDVKTYSITHMGCMRVVNNTVQLYGYNRQVQAILARALDNIIELEGDNEYGSEEEVDEETEIEIEDSKTRRTWSVTLADLKRPQFVPRPNQPLRNGYNKTFTQFLKDPEENKYANPVKSAGNSWNKAAQKAGIGSELWRGTSESQFGFKSWLESNG